MHFRTRITVPFIGLALLAGCNQNVPPPERAVAVAPDTPERPRPLPEPTDPNADQPRIHVQLPEEPRFVDAYSKVGKPSILIFVNRDVAGEPMAENPAGPDISVEHTRESTGAVSVNDGGGGYYHSPYDYYSHGYDYNHSFQSSGPAKYTERTDVYLRPGQYDEASAKSIDYQAIENKMAEWLGAEGRVNIISPIMARQRLGNQEVADLQSGRPQMLGEIAQKLRADILVQNADGLHVRLIAEAFNTKEEGHALAHAGGDITLPLSQSTIYYSTRKVTGTLMDQMTDSFEVMAANVPATQPVPK